MKSTCRTSADTGSKYSTNSKRKTPCPTAVTRSYQIEQTRDYPDASRDEAKSGDNLTIKHSREFDGSDKFYTFRYYSPLDTRDNFFKDELEDSRHLEVEDFHKRQDEDTKYVAGKIHTTRVVVGDLFRLAGYSGIWRFVGMSKPADKDHYNEMLVFEPHNSIAEDYVHNYLNIPKADFGQKFGPFKDIIGSGMGHQRIGTTADIVPNSSDQMRPNDSTPSSQTAKPDYPNYEKGPMYPTGVKLKTYDTVPQSLCKE